MNKLWCMPCVWRNCYQCIDFALLHFHSLSSWYLDLWFSSLNHLNNLWHYLPKWYILSFLSLLCFRSLFFPFSFTYLHRTLDRYDYSVTASSGSGDPPPNGGHAQPIQPPSTNTNFNHIISEKLDVVNSLLEIAGWTCDQLLLS